MLRRIEIIIKPTGHATIMAFNDEHGIEEVCMVGAAKASPVMQCVRLLIRLLLLSDKIAGYNQ